jgi:hypothetical protein
MIKNRFHASTKATPNTNYSLNSLTVTPISLQAIPPSLLFSSGEVLPHWMANNPFLISGYRRPTGSFMACFRSLFHVHNETVCIWSHFLTAIIFGCFVCQSLSYGTTSDNWIDVVVVRYYMLSSILCMMFNVRKISSRIFLSLQTFLLYSELLFSS